MLNFIFGVFVGGIVMTVIISLCSAAKCGDCAYVKTVLREIKEQ
jgi:hypothetical protein